MAFNKNKILVGHLGFHAIEKNAQHLQTGIRRIWTQHTLADRKQPKNIIYVEKQGYVVSSLDYFSVTSRLLLPLTGSCKPIFEMNDLG